MTQRAARIPLVKNNASAASVAASSSCANFHRDVVWKQNRLLLRGRLLATILPDEKWPGMWRVQLHGGHLSDMVNLTRAKDAAVTLAYGALS
jgi:hypothetical protein